MSNWDVFSMAETFSSSFSFLFRTSLMPTSSPVCMCVPVVTMVALSKRERIEEVSEEKRREEENEATTCCCR